MAAGKHPFPFRTRQLSPPAPMVLGGRPPGRVGRRRDFFMTWARRIATGPCHVSCQKRAHHNARTLARCRRTPSALLRGVRRHAARNRQSHGPRLVRRVRAARRGLGEHRLDLIDRLPGLGLLSPGLRIARQVPGARLEAGVRPLVPADRQVEQANPGHGRPIVPKVTDAQPGPVPQPPARGGPIPTKALVARGQLLVQAINDPAIEMDRHAVIAPGLTADVPPDRPAIGASGHTARVLRRPAVPRTPEIGLAGIVRATIGDGADRAGQVATNGMRLVPDRALKVVRFVQAADPRRPVAGFRP